jgi:Flp pilus assembly pilin Flp
VIVAMVALVIVGAMSAISGGMNKAFEKASTAAAGS